VIALGVLVVAAAVSPWADAAADASLRAHMLQHLALMLVAAPLLVLGVPRHGALRALPRFGARAALALGHPLVGLSAFAAAELGTHFTPLYDLAARNVAAHVAEHALLLGGGMLFWWAVLGPTTSLSARVLLLLFAMPVHALVGVVLLLDDRPRYAEYPSLSDQHAAAALDWSVGSMLLGSALALAGWRWVAGEHRRTLAREAYGR
jgi:cytochrome c oxidase assembly factor CtaG